jgi:hypothetical protein
LKWRYKKAYLLSKRDFPQLLKHLIYERRAVVTAIADVEAKINWIRSKSDTAVNHFAALRDLEFMCCTLNTSV